MHNSRNRAQMESQSGMIDTDDCISYRPASLQQKLRQVTAIQKHRIARQRDEVIEGMLEQMEISRVKLKEAARNLKLHRQKYQRTKVSSLAEELIHNGPVIVPYSPTQDGIVVAIPDEPVSTEFQNYDPNRDVIVDRYPFTLQVKTDNCEEARFTPKHLCDGLRQAVEDVKLPFAAEFVSNSFSPETWADLVTLNHKCDRVAGHQKNSDGSCSFQLCMYILRLRDEVQPLPERPRFDDALRASRQAREALAALSDSLAQQEPPATTE